MGVNHKVKTNPESKYERAKERVKEIKGWYNHLLIFIVVNTILQTMYSGYIEGIHLYVGESIFGRLIGPVVWGFALLIHAIWVFKSHYIRRSYKDWEEQKIEKIMKEDTDAFNDQWK